MGIVRYVGSAKQALTRWKQHLKGSHNQEVNTWVDELRALGMEPLCTAVRMVPADDRDREERLLIKAHEGPYLFNVTMRSRGRRVPAQIEYRERIVEKYIRYVETETVYVDADPEVYARLRAIGYQTDLLIQELEEARAGMQMLFEELHPELTEDWDLEPSGDERESNGDDEPNGDEFEEEPDAEADDFGGDNDQEWEWETWVLKPIDQYRIDARTPGFQVKL